MFKTLLGYYKKHRFLFFFDMFCVLVEANVDIVFPYLTRYIIQGKITVWQEVLYIGLALLFLYSFRYLCAFCITYYGHVLGIRIETDMRTDLFHKFEYMDYQYFDDKQSGELLANLTSHMFDISEASHHSPEDILSSVYIIIGSFVICLVVNPLLTGLVFLGVLALFIFTLLRRKKMMAVSRAVRGEQASISSQINSSLAGIQLTKAFNNEEEEIKKFDTYNNNYKTAKLKWIWQMGVFHSTTAYLTNITNLILLVAGGLMFLYNKISAADLVMFFLYVNFLISPVKVLSNTVETTQTAWAGYERFYNVMKIENKIVSKENAVVVDHVDGDISFNNVTFRYKKDNEDILTNFSLKINKGSKTAIVGETGVGKSTISKIIPRFYDVSDGEVLIDNINVKDYELYSLRKCIGHVQQDVFIFWGSIMDNIRFGNPKATDEMCIEAAKKANIHEFILSLPNQYDTLCGERGIQLSGGQKQRISIARIFLKDPSILILDEATSALDNVTEKLIQKSFDELAIGKTTIVIAHRLTTIQNADNIVVLGKEGIIEQGTHEELMKLNNVYARMYNASKELS